MSTRRLSRGAARTGPPVRHPDPDSVTPAERRDLVPVGMLAVVIGFIALSISALHGYMLLYGDAVAHLGIARRIVDTDTPGLAMLGGVWLPLPHLLMLPFVQRMEWWQNGMAGAWPSLICFVIGVMGMYRLARHLVAPRWAIVATVFFGLNANLLYLSTTAMTEPLFLALLLWLTVGTIEFLAALKSSQHRIAINRLILLGLLIFAAVMTRYDGWILGAVIWLVVTFALVKRPVRGLLPAYVTFTLLTLAGPLAWFEYNHVFAHDWLDFMRGPYSAKEIDRKTSPPGSHHYFGWHNPAWSLMLYARTAQVDAAAWETGWLLAAATLCGTWKFLKQQGSRAALLLWVPLPFYVYSISYGSVPIFIPQLYPHAFYNSRYGMELLPALAIFGAFSLAVFAAYLKRVKPLAVGLIFPIAMMLIVLNTVWMLHATPLVLDEAIHNSRGRLALEEPLARQLETFERGAPILMENSDHVGALQTAGIPLRQTIGPGNYYRFRAALAAPAETAAYVIVTGDDAIGQAVKEHPQGLTELTILCSTGQSCVRVYSSSLYVRK